MLLKFVFPVVLILFIAMIVLFALGIAKKKTACIIGAAAILILLVLCYFALLKFITSM